MERKGKERKSIYIAPFRTKVHTKRSGMDHTVLPANNTMTAFPSWRSPDVTTTATEAADIHSGGFKAKGLVGHRSRGPPGPGAPAAGPRRWSEASLVDRPTSLTTFRHRFAITGPFTAFRAILRSVVTTSGALILLPVCSGHPKLNTGQRRLTK